MDKELLELLDKARASGANEVQLQGIVDSYRAKKSNRAPVLQESDYSMNPFSSDSKPTNKPSFAGFGERLFNETKSSNVNRETDTQTLVQPKQKQSSDSFSDLWQVVKNGYKKVENAVYQNAANELDTDLKEGNLITPEKIKTFSDKPEVLKPILEKYAPEYTSLIGKDSGEDVLTNASNAINARVKFASEFERKELQQKHESEVEQYLSIMTGADLSAIKTSDSAALKLLNEKSNEEKGELNALELKYPHPP